MNDILLRELESLSQQRQEDVLAFVRFLKIGLVDSQYLEDRGRARDYRLLVN